MTKSVSPIALFLIVVLTAGCTLSTRPAPKLEQPTVSVDTNSDAVMPETPISTLNPASPDVAISVEPTQDLTETPDPTDPPLSLLEGPLLSITAVDLDQGSMYLVDLANGAGRRLQFDAGHPIGVRWEDDGCQLNIELDPFGTDNSLKIIHTDLQGNILDEIIQYSADDRPDTDAEHWLGRWSLSPSGEWLAYFVSSGQLFYDWTEFQDIEVVPVNKSIDPIALTDQGGVTDFAWSPDGQKLAYSDFDANGRRQLYIYNVANNEEIQLTHFDEQNLPDNWTEPRFNSLVWSKDSQFIAFERRFYEASFTESKGDFWIVSTTGDSQKRIFPGEMLFESMVVWRGSIIGWSADNRILAVQFHATYSDTEQEAIYWLNAIDGAVIDQFLGDQLPSGHLSKAYPLDGINEIVFPYIQPVYVYDFQAGSLSQIPLDNLPDIIHMRITVSPIDFPGETACRP